jgi:hypothetical protein
MTDQDTPTLKHAIPQEEVDIGRPVEWMVDPGRPEIILGVTYVFSTTDERKTVWYTANKRRPKLFTVVLEPPKA